MTSAAFSGIGSSVQLSKTVQNGLVKIKNSFGNAKGAITGKFKTSTANLPKSTRNANTRATSGKKGYVKPQTETVELQYQTGIMAGTSGTKQGFWSKLFGGKNSTPKPAPTPNQSNTVTYGGRTFKKATPRKASGSGDPGIAIVNRSKPKVSHPVEQVQHNNATINQKSNMSNNASNVYRTGHSQDVHMDAVLSKFAGSGSDIKTKLYDLDIAFTQIDNQQVKRYMQSKLDAMAKSSTLDMDLLKELQQLADATNSFNGNYVSIDGMFASFNKQARQRSGPVVTRSDGTRYRKPGEKLFNNDGSINNETLTKQLGTNKSKQIEIVKKDLAQEAHIEGIKDYIAGYPKSPMCNVLYDKYLTELKTQGVSPQVIAKCKKINESFGTKVFLSAQDNPEIVLNDINVELSKWVKASQGQAKLPPYIDFTTIDTEWYETTHQAYSNYWANGALSFKKQSHSSLMSIKTLRHELTHTNDNILGDIPSKYDFDKICKKYTPELRRAGLANFAIDYGKTKPWEFIAVAAQGDLSSYSQEFRKVLIDFGMPPWMFNLD